MATGSGDKLARGAIRASFQMPNVSQEAWDAMFKDYDPKAFAKKKAPKVKAEKNLVRV